MPTVRRFAAALSIPCLGPRVGGAAPSPSPRPSLTPSGWPSNRRMLCPCRPPGGPWIEFVADVTAQPRCGATSPCGAQRRPPAADQLNASRACVEEACRGRGRGWHSDVRIWGRVGVEAWLCVHSIHMRVCREGPVRWGGGGVHAHLYLQLLVCTWLLRFRVCTRVWAFTAGILEVNSATGPVCEMSPSEPLSRKGDGVAAPGFGGCQETRGSFGEAAVSTVRLPGLDQHARKGEQSKRLQGRTSPLAPQRCGVQSPALEPQTLPRTLAGRPGQER